MKGRPAIELCDEAVHLLRRLPARTIALYYAGSVPFIIDFLFFWTDMSQSATANERAVPASLLLALLYLWMTTCQAIFARQLLASLTEGTQALPEWRNWIHTAFEQAAVQPTKFAVLPLAGLFLLPFGFAYALYHNYSAVRAFSAARKQAALWPEQNWVFLSILSALSVVVFVNIGMALFLFPRLAKMLLGIDTVFTRSAYTFLNTTLLAATAGLSYLILNPFVKAFYVLRCFYGESITTARDLRAQLKSVSAAVGMGLLLAAGLFAQPPVNDLDRSIDRVLRRPEYSWRTPRTAHAGATGRNWFVRSTIAVLDWTERSLKQVGRWLDDLAERIAKLAGKRSPTLPDPRGAKPPTGSLRAVLVVLLAAAAGVIVFMLWRWLAGRRLPGAALTIRNPVDLRADDLQADDRPLDQWLEMARDCMERQELRLALRALYLAGLSLLASESLIALERSKSDRDYARELTRKARNRPEVIEAFTQVLGVFERGWYGMYSVDPISIDQVRANLDRMRARAL